MGKASRLRRREAKQQTHCDLNKENITCPICLETTDKTNWIKLPCGHTFHKSCSVDWVRTQVQNQSDNDKIRLLAPLGRIGNTLPIVAYENGQGIIQCAVCRCEYDMIRSASEPKQILAKVNFAEDLHGNTHTHYITHISELRHYTPKLCHDLEQWMMFLQCLIEGINSKKDTELYPVYCTCTREDCFGFMLINQWLFDRSIDGGFVPNASGLRHLRASELEEHVKELKLSSIKKIFKNKR